MAGKTIAQKLLIKENYRVILLNQPAGYQAKLGELPQNVTVLEGTAESADLIQIFLTTRLELEENLGNLRARLKPQGLLWITYPKGTSKVETDLNRDIIRGYVESNGFKAVALVAVDDTWSAMRVKV